MVRFSPRSALAVATLLVAAAACGRDLLPSSPQAQARQLTPSAPSANALTTPTHGIPMLRNKPLSHGDSVSAVVGPSGGMLSLADAGGTLIIPPGALTQNVRITMTARPGNRVAYDFAPHGLLFKIAATLKQDFSLVQGHRPVVRTATLGYYADPDDQLTLTELLTVSANMGRDEGTSSIGHFSGYIYISGRQ